MKEILTSIKFDDGSEMLKITQYLISAFESSINNSSHLLVVNRALSQIRSATKLNELSTGIDQFNYLKDNRKALTTDKATNLPSQLENIVKRLLNKKRLNA